MPQNVRGPAEQPPRPDKNCYWLIPGKLLAGEYPGHYTDDAARKKVSRFLEAGVDFFINLTEAGELYPYDDIAQQEAAKRGLTIEHRRMSIMDLNVPNREHMAAILNTIDDAIAAGRTVYVHCWGGIGRTGTVIGCYLVRHGMTGNEALNEIARLWQNMAKQDRFPHSPETEIQIDYIRYWKEARPQQPNYHFDRFRGALLGLAVGDAVGTTLEFKPPGTFTPIDDMAGGGPFNLQPGQWTDDTSMALCLAASLVEKQGLDPYDQMERYGRWWRQGYLSSTGHCFDIGNTVAGALRQFQADGHPLAGPTAPNTAGNGSIMRLAPVPLFYVAQPAVALEQSGESSKTTHGTPMAVDACRYLGGLLVGAINGASKEQLLSAHYSPVPNYWDSYPLHPKIAAVAAGSYKAKNPPDIRGTGFVVASLEAALWAFYHTDNFRDGCLKAVNLGDDADTTGAVYGQIAGAFYGASAIPSAWVEKLALRDTIENLIKQLYNLALE